MKAMRAGSLPGPMGIDYEGRQAGVEQFSNRLNSSTVPFTEPDMFRKATL
jgi:hypothetical protein